MSEQLSTTAAQSALTPNPSPKGRGGLKRTLLKLGVFLLPVVPPLLIAACQTAPRQEVSATTNASVATARQVEPERDTPSDRPAQAFENSAALPIVSLDASPEIFPSRWLQPDMSACAEPLLDRELQSKACAVVKEAMDRYPQGMLAQHLDVIYVLNVLRIQDVELGGTFANRSVYVATRLSFNAPRLRTSHDWRAMNWMIERTCHAEIAAVVMEQHRSKFPESQWRTINPHGFEYMSSGVDAIKQGKSSLTVGEVLWRDGFLTAYSQSTFENDAESFIANLLMNNEKFWNNVAKYPRLQWKAQLAIQFLHDVDERFSEEYLRSLPPTRF